MVVLEAQFGINYKNNMKILVTGSSGMIGSELVDQLKERGHEVVGLDIVPSKWVKGSTDIIHDLRTEIGTKYSDLILTKFDMVIHLAANARVYNLVMNPQLALDNVLMVHNIFEFTRQHKIPRLLFASSRETYGNGNRMPVSENAASQRRSESNYTAGKIFGEAYCYAYKTCYNIDSKIARFSNVYGRYDDSDRFIPKVISKLKENRPFEIYGEGKTLSFTYIEDCISGIIRLIDTWDGKASIEKEFNIAADEQHSLLDVAFKVKEMLNSESAVTVGKNLVGEVMNFQPDITKMKNLGWSPVTSIDEGLKKSIEYYTK